MKVQAISRAIAPLKKPFFHSSFSFPPRMSQAVYGSTGEECKSTPKISRSRHGHDLGHVIDVDLIDQILIFDDISNVER